MMLGVHPMMMGARSGPSIPVPRTWTVASTGTSNSLIGSTFGGGVFVASGSSNTVRHSTDGISWSAATGGFASTNRRGVFFKDKFILGTNVNNVLISNDGMSFSLSPVLKPASFVSASESRAVGVDDGGSGGLWYTSDASSFTVNGGPLASGLRSVLVDEPYVYVVGSVSFGGLWRTGDFSGWTSIAHGFSSGTIIGIASGEGVKILLDSSGNVRRSTDGGSTYVSVPVILPNAPTTLKFLNGIFIAPAASGMVHFSSNGGLSWETVYTGISSTINDVSFGNGKFIVVAQNGSAAWSIPS